MRRMGLTGRQHRRALVVELSASVLVGCAGLKLGYDFGLRISGVLMGVVASLGTGLVIPTKA